MIPRQKGDRKLTGVSYTPKGFINDPETNEMTKTTYRAPWALPKV